LATAENTAYAYDDGEILGSLIGRIDIETMKIDFKKLAPQINLKANLIKKQPNPVSDL
jgi:hypothetical protein